MAISDGSTIIGESIVINGNLNGDEDLTVRGRVEGTLTLTKTLVVEPTGVVIALDQCIQARLMDRHLSSVQAFDFPCINVHAYHVVAGIGQACTGDQPYVARAKDGDFHSLKL